MKEALPDNSHQEEIERERQDLLDRLTDWLETPMVVLAFVWLGLLVTEFVSGENRILNTASLSIWVIFIADFALKFLLAPRKLRFLASNWLTALSLALPALRVFRVWRVVRVFRLAGVSRGLRLVRVLSSVNRGMRALGTTMQRRGLGYVLLLTVVVAFAGAAGMYAFEKSPPGGGGLESYPTALWWTAMILTTMGSEIWPKTPEGRLLCLLLALYAFTIFGYITASLASFFVGRDAEDADEELAGVQGVAALRQEIAALREEVQKLIPAQDQAGSTPASSAPRERPRSG